MISTISLLLVTFIISVLFCGVYLRLAKRWKILDVPNERSSHDRPTPSGGGLPLMLAFFLGAALLFGVQVLWYPPYSFVLFGAIFLTVLGVADDKWALSVRLRFFSYGLCCVLVAAALLRGALPDASLALIFFTAFVMLWALNLYNFMDGVDGVAATQCFLTCLAVAVLVWSSGTDSSYAAFCLLLGFSHLGFLVWNWPAAKLFMGDAGSIPAGFTMAALAVLGGVQGYLSIACWLVLLAVFITDASWTLTRRIITRQRFTQAHRSHAYQRLSRHWGSHKSVAVLLIFVNVMWLFPLAWAIVLWPQYTITLVIVAYLPLLVCMAKLPDIT